MFWIALAAQVSVPTLVDSKIPDVRALFSVDDFPAYMLRATEVSKTVYTRTTVRTDGSIQSCVAEGTSGDRRLDAYTCALIIKRAKFLPARWADGSATYGVIRVPVSWVITNVIPSPEDALRATVPDLELSVNELPKGAHKLVGVMLEVGVDEGGRGVSCFEYPFRARNDRSRRFPELIPLACEQAISTLTVRAPSDSSGKPVRSVQTASVLFKLDH